MKVCVSGSSGFIGKELVRFLEQNKIEVISIARSDFDLTLQKLAQKLSGADAVVHLAGKSIFTRWTKKNKTEIIKSRVNTTRKLINAIAFTDVMPKVFISTSAVGVYDDKESHDEFSDHLADDFLGQVCKKWEKEVFASSNMPLRLVVFRLGVVLGKSGGAFPKLAKMFKSQLGAIVGDGYQSFPFIHIDDLLSAFWFIMFNNDAVGVFNIVAPEFTSNRKFSEILAKVYHQWFLWRIPGWMVRLFMGKSSDLILKGQHAIPKRLLELDFPFEFPNAHNAISNLVDK